MARRRGGRVMTEPATDKGRRLLYELQHSRITARDLITHIEQMQGGLDRAEVAIRADKATIKDLESQITLGVVEEEE
jgi:hypothetical protein